MDMNLVYGAGLVALIAIVLVFAVTGEQRGTGDIDVDSTASPSNGSSADIKMTDDHTRYTVHPWELVQGCPGKDCIPSIDNPKFQSSEEAAWLDDQDLVIALEVNGEAKAYPFRILNVHEIVNDNIGGEAVAVTYCPLCRSGLAYSREVNGEVTEFGVSGKLWNANLVMYDRATETYWSQVEGEAIVGPLVPAELDLVNSVITEWGKWKESHPDTEVLSRDTGIYPPSQYGSNPYTGYQSSSRVGFGVGEVDDRLHSKELVYGVAVGNSSKAYVESDIEEADVINDEVGGVPVLVVEDQESGGIRVFSRKVGNKTIKFSLENGILTDSEGDQWSFEGEALEGEKQGEQLDQLNSHGFFWFAWSSFHPETEIYEG